jgi:predicted Zn-dependent peptidase
MAEGSRNVVMMQLSRGAICVALCMAGAAAEAPPARAQDEPAPMPANPFGVFESFRLGNGLRVWYGQLPGATVSSMAVTVPAGFDHDPPGLEHTAHFLEHVLLSDRDGRTEAELVRELTGRGGTYNGYTFADRTTYTVNIGTDQAAAGVRWLFGVVTPRVLTDDLVVRNREPVAIEVGARARTPLERAATTVIHHPSLRPAGYWQREFGIATAFERNTDTFRSIQTIRAAHLHAFYDTHYAPTQMTLVIVSGVPRAVLQPVLDETFALLPWRPPAERPVAAPRSGESRRFAWRVSRNTTLRIAYRIPDLTGRDQLRLALMGGLLERRLMEQLRRGEDKAVYSASVATILRGPAAAFVIAASFDPARESAVRAAVDAQLRRLSNAADDTLFYVDRDALARDLRTRYAAPDALRAIATDRFHDPDLHDEFPDLGAYVTTAGADSIGAYAARLFDADNRILRLSRPLPLPATWIVVIATAIVLAAVRLYRAIALQPADMRRIRFVARLRAPDRLLVRSALVVGFALAGRLVFAAAHFAAEHHVLTIDSATLHFGLAGLLLFASAFAAIATIGTLQHKVLVFADEVRIKSPTYRSRRIPAARIAGATRLSASDALPARVRWNPLRRRGSPVLLELTDGSGLLLHVARPDALLEALHALIADGSGSAETAPAASAPASPVTV